MPDVLTPAQRHRCMSHIRSKATKPEITVRKWLWAHGYRYRLNVKSVPGKPDIADALDSLPNERYRRLLVGLYREHLSMQFMAEEMEVSLPNLYNLHRRALASLKAHMTKPQA